MCSPCRGFCFAEYVDHDHAHNALQLMIRPGFAGIPSEADGPEIEQLEHQHQLQQQFGVIASGGIKVDWAEPLLDGASQSCVAWEGAVRLLVYRQYLWRARAGIISLFVCVLTCSSVELREMLVGAGESFFLHGVCQYTVSSCFAIFIRLSLCTPYPHTT